jgi:hypothetical protein
VKTNAVGGGNKDGGAVRYLQLDHNQWDPAARAARMRVLHSFGRGPGRQAGDRAAGRVAVPAAGPGPGGGAEQQADPLPANAHGPAGIVGYREGSQEPDLHRACCPLPPACPLASLSSVRLSILGPDPAAPGQAAVQCPIQTVRTAMRTPVRPGRCAWGLCQRCAGHCQVLLAFAHRNGG